MPIEYAQLYCRSGNIGDDVQALAAAQHLPKPASAFIDRDRIDAWTGDGPAAVIMNGWFSSGDTAWPPAALIRPIFVGFHVTERFKPAVRAHAAYLKRFEPIGVRDRATEMFLTSLGVASETTFCLTLTFPRRSSAPREGKVFLVDAEEVFVPKSLRKGAVKVTHLMPPLDYRVTLPAARQLIDLYREDARLVVTTRLHAALPCMAMGIPVVFLGDPKDTRTSIVRDVGGVIHDLRLHRKSLARGVLGRVFDAIDWSPQPVDLEAHKAVLKEAVAKRLARLT